MQTVPLPAQQRPVVPRTPDGSRPAQRPLSSTQAGVDPRQHERLYDS